MKTLRLEELTVEQKIGQLIMARSIVNPNDFAFAMELIKNHALGGVQVIPSQENIEKCIIPTLKEADYPIFIAADMETGFQLGNLFIPGNLALGAMNDPDLSYQFARITAKQAKKCGYNMIWSPVVDNCGYDCPNIVPRCISSDKIQVARLAIPYMKAFSDCGVIGSAKHYPSGDDSVMDSHMSPTLSCRTKEQLLDNSPYVAMMNALGDDMTGIMTSHTYCVKIDTEYPASLSKPCIDIIREAGYDGLVITDSLSMMGVLQDFKDDTIMGIAIAAGNDLLLPNYRIPLRDTYYRLLDNYKSGLFSEARLNDAVRHVLHAQEKTMHRLSERELQVTAEDIALVDRINRDCVCAYVDAGLMTSIDKNVKHLFAIDIPNVYTDETEAGLHEISTVEWWEPDKIANRLKEEYPNSEVTFFCEYPSRHEVEQVCYKATKADDVVFITFCTSECYQGTDGLTERARIMMEAVQKKTAAVVHFGNPYAMEKIAHVPRIIFGFPSRLCIDNALNVLSGKYPAKGTMPIALKLK